MSAHTNFSMVFPQDMIAVGQNNYGPRSNDCGNRTLWYAQTDSPRAPEGNLDNLRSAPKSLGTMRQQDNATALYWLVDEDRGYRNSIHAHPNITAAGKRCRSEVHRDMS